ncbi:MAG: hypothetical protein OQL11_06490 [Gammaproteobacteria bacterium]|nr:hypothetical protein [Gammaproteobacteria bacterium]
MTRLTKALKKMLNALAVADAGEYLTSTQKNEYLRKAHGIAPLSAPATADSPASADSAQGRRRIALYMGMELRADMIDYVIQTCTRLNHDLTVLTFESGQEVRGMLDPFRDALKTEGIDLRVHYLTGDPVRGLGRYLRSHPEIAFLACKDTGYLGRSILKGTQRQNALPVPVVLLGDAQISALQHDETPVATPQARSTVA